MSRFRSRHDAGFGAPVGLAALQRASHSDRCWTATSRAVGAIVRSSRLRLGYDYGTSSVHNFSDGVGFANWITYYTPHSFSAPSRSVSTSISPLSLPPYARYPSPLPAPPPPPSLILSTSSLPRIAATAVFRLGARTAFAPPPIVLPLPALLGSKTVFRLLDADSCALGAGGGGGTEKRARSCDSVSRMRAVMSWGCSSALVKILGGGKLGVVLAECSLLTVEESLRTGALRWRRSRAISAPNASRGGT